MQKVIQPQILSKVLVIGDACDDIYFFGTCRRKNPESPAPLLLVERSEIRGGMALNVAMNAISLGLTVDVVTNDVKPRKERFFDSSYSQQLLRVDTDCHIESITLERLLSIEFEKYDAVVVSDYDKGFLKTSDLSLIVSKCICPVFVDTKKTNLSSIDKPNVFIKINDVERRLLTEPVPKQAKIITTLGGAGAQFEGQIFPAYICPVFDVCGAGDTFLAALAFAYIMTSDIKLSIDFANKCASITVQHVGTYVVKHSDIQAQKH